MLANLMSHLPVILQAANRQQGGSVFWTFLPFILIFLIIYFLMIRPQSKKQKELQRMIASLKKGDKVVTVGGIYGTIAGVKEKEGTFILKVDDNVKIEISKSAVARKLS